MKLVDILKEITFDDSDYLERKYKELKDKGAKFLGRGDYGVAFLLKGKVYKITTDSVELDHAIKLLGKETEYFAHIYEVDRKSESSGTITMEYIDGSPVNTPDDVVEAISKEAESLGIDPDELDWYGDSSNVILDKSGNYKMIDV